MVMNKGIMHGMVSLAKQIDTIFKYAIAEKTGNKNITIEECRKLNLERRVGQDGVERMYLDGELIVEFFLHNFNGSSVLRLDQDYKVHV